MTLSESVSENCGHGFTDFAAGRKVGLCGQPLDAASEPETQEAEP